VKARAPGKILLSGAYAVLEGAPAIVAAVDRYVTADGERPPERVTEEVRVALGAANAPWFDASELRRGERKLGVGSSAAILVASLAVRALERVPDASDAALSAEVFAPALAAHRTAQRGGSGVDVAASTYGGVLSYRRGPADAPSLRALSLPSALVIEVYFSGESASTPQLIARVDALRASDRALHATLLSAQAAAASEAESAALAADSERFVRALSDQARVLAELGARAGAGIVTDACRALGQVAEREGGTALPSGAGGGDVLLFAGTRPSSPEFRALAARLGHELLPLSLGARGVHACPSPSR
jgi:phosphomevalonate kinase